MFTVWIPPCTTHLQQNLFFLAHTHVMIFISFTVHQSWLICVIFLECVIFRVFFVVEKCFIKMFHFPFHFIFVLSILNFKYQILKIIFQYGTPWKVKHVSFTSKSQCKFSATTSTLCFFLFTLCCYFIKHIYSHSIICTGWEKEGKSYNMKKGFTTAVTSSIDIFFISPWI